MKSIIIPLCLTLALLGLSSAHDDFECNVTQAEGLTTYRVPDFQHTHCQCSWSNATNFPLANHGLKIDNRVVNKSDTTLITRVCVEKITYRRNCISEGSERVATCEINCTDTTGTSPPDEKIHPFWTCVPIAVPLVVLVVMGLMLGGFILYCMCRGPAFRRVPAQNPDPAPQRSTADADEHCMAMKDWATGDATTLTSGMDAPN